MFYLKLSVLSNVCLLLYKRSRKSRAKVILKFCLCIYSVFKVIFGVKFVIFGRSDFELNSSVFFILFFIYRFFAQLVHSQVMVSEVLAITSGVDYTVKGFY